MIPYKNTQTYKDYIKRHDIHFNGKYHAAFFLVVNESLDEVFLVKNKYTN